MIVDWDNDFRFYILYDMETFGPVESLTTEEPKKLFLESKVRFKVFLESKVD